MIVLDKPMTHDEMIKRVKSKKPFLYSVYIGNSHPYDDDVLVSCVLLRKIEGIKINLDTREWEFMIEEYSNEKELLYTDLKTARDAVKKWAKYWHYNDNKAVIGWNKTHEEMKEQDKKVIERLEKEKNANSINNSDIGIN